MKRPLVLCAVGYITGIIWGLYLNTSIVPIFFGVISFLFYKGRNQENKRDLKNANKYLLKIYNSFKKIKLKHVIIFSIFAIISNAQILYLENKHETLYKNLEDVKIIGTIISDKEETEYKNRHTIKVEELNGSKKYTGTCLLIYTKKNADLEYGDKIIINGIYEEANEATNYGAFDYKEYLKEKNIYGIVNVEELETIKHNNLNIILITFNDLRNNIKTNFQEILDKDSSVAIGILLRRYFWNWWRNNRRF